MCSSDLNALVQELIDCRFVTPGGMSIAHVFGTGTKDDARYGIDLRLVCIGERRFFVPLQVKSRDKDQHEHQKKYVAIPSIVVRWNEDNESISKKLATLIDAYAAGTVAHV